MAQSTSEAINWPIPLTLTLGPHVNRRPSTGRNFLRHFHTAWAHKSQLPFGSFRRNFCRCHVSFRDRRLLRGQLSSSRRDNRQKLTQTGPEQVQHRRLG